VEILSSVSRRRLVLQATARLGRRPAQAAAGTGHADITDLTALQGIPLEDFRLTPKNITKGLNISATC
jgi:hypothetical protein